MSSFTKKIVMVGFGSVGQGVLPLLAKHFDAKHQVVIVAPNMQDASIATEYQVPFHPHALTKDNYREILGTYLNPGDFLLNLSVEVSSCDLIEFAQEIGCLYLDTCIEPWDGEYLDPTKTAHERTNYALREKAMALKAKLREDAPTALITHGANPGLVSSFTKQALIAIAKDTNAFERVPTSRAEWAQLARKLNIKSIHVAEYDWQVSTSRKKPGEFVNTWSIDGLHSEGCQPAELGWGTHEKNWPARARSHDHGCQAAIFLDQPGITTGIKSWTPLAGQFRGFLITHNEAISIADYFTVCNEELEPVYRPTVHYSYRPCDDAILSLHELKGRDFVLQNDKRLLRDEITDGIDELGVLLMGHKKGAYWFGSQLCVHEARRLAPYNSATSLQITSAVLAGVLWAIENPCRGVVEPEDTDYERILEIAMPYLGKVEGYYTSWTPLSGTSDLFPQSKDLSDPWQFVNFLLDERA